MSNQSPIEYIVIGAGPAAICAVAKLYGSGIPGHQILWVDKQFKVGDFGTTLSAGTSVPGNTTVDSYNKVNQAIYHLIPACEPTPAELLGFEISSFSPEVTCSLKIAAHPLQLITDKLRKFVHSEEGLVTSINETNTGLEVTIHLTNGLQKTLITKRAILATGSKPKTLDLPKHITLIDSNIGFIESELNAYLSRHPAITNVAVFGSSHSAALATMHLLEAGMTVTQFMNKEYKFATPAISPEGIKYTQYDNTGLKGLVAAYTRQLLAEKLSRKWNCYIGASAEDIFDSHLSSCSHAITCIGYSPSNSLQINGLSISSLTYDNQSTQIKNSDNKDITGLFGIGIAFPLEVKAPSGDKELAVGVGKFWDSINSNILQLWDQVYA